jgi:hypothetical protein
MKLTLLLVPLPLAAVLLLPDTPPPLPATETADEWACRGEDRRVGHGTVRVPWKRIAVVYDDVDVLYCVFTGDSDSPLAFERGAERIRFTLVGRGEQVRDGSFSFAVTTSTGRSIRLGPAAIHIAPGGQRSCRVEICQAFTDPGERVVDASVRVH